MKRLLLVLLVLGCFASLAAAQAGKGKAPPVGGTRIAVVDIARLFEACHPFGSWRTEKPDGVWLLARTEAKTLLDSIASIEKMLRQTPLSAAEKKGLEQKIARNKDRLKTLTDEMTLHRQKRSEEDLVGIWKQINDAVRIYATQNGIDIVLAYGDPREKELLDGFPNVNRKMQAMDQGSSLPIFVSPRADITEAVANLIAERRREKLKAR